MCRILMGFLGSAIDGSEDPHGAGVRGKETGAESCCIIQEKM